LQSLSVGNVVSAATRIYRDRFQLYYRLAFIGYLWILVPIYGWAKFSAMTGLLSRLAYSELIERPETVNEARRFVNPRMWSFLLAGFLASLIFLGAMLGFAVVVGIPTGVLATFFGQSAAAVVGYVLLGLIAFLILIIGYLWLASRLFIIEVPLAMENNVDATSAISRSWQLTKGFALRLVLIVTVAWLLTIPVSIVVQIVLTFIQVALAALFPPDSTTFNLLYIALALGFSFVSAALLIPFWQAIKAVVYYDLRNRKEGLGINLRDSQ
jgi:magnesium-transporting ATPase (P-type)